MKYPLPPSAQAAIGIAAGLLLAGCGSSGLPAGPTSTPPVAAQPVPAPAPLPYAGGDRWDLQSTYKGHTGPEACIAPFDGQPRQSTGYALAIQRYGATIHLVTEHNHYVGTVAGDEFVGRDRDDARATWQCGTSRIFFRTEGQVSGRFSQDGRVLTGEEVAVFLLESGETIRRYWDWTATRQ